MRSADSADGALSRRRFLQASFGAGAAALTWTPMRTLTRGDAEAGAAPPAFPAYIALSKQLYENWALEVRVDDVWTAAPKNVNDVVRIANWAHAHGWRVRPSGAKHGWAPFTVMPDQPADAEVVLVDTRAYLNRITVDRAGMFVNAQAGAAMDDIMIALEREGLGFTSIPAPGDVTLAGVLAINGHGAALPAAGEDTRGRSYGSMSNRVLSLTAVVWDPSAQRYSLRKFDRAEKITKALLTTLGRAFITSATLRAEHNVNLRCVSDTSIPAAELFAATTEPGKRTFASFVEQTGRAEAIWFPFTDKPWLKTWSVAPTKPAASRAVTGAYNYTFSDNIPLPIARFARAIVAGEAESTPAFGQTAFDVSVAGLAATATGDIWGPARNTQHYIRATTLRAAEFGYGILTKRSNIQRALHDFVSKYEELVAQYRARGMYPSNMPVELRCTGVDDPAAIGVPGAEAPVLAGTSPSPAHPDFDVVIWVNVLTLVGSAGVFRFKRDLENWVVHHYTGDYANARVEWSKGWGYTDEGGWKSALVIDDVIPNGLRAGRSADANWDWAVARLNELDPHRVFSNAFLDRVLK